MCFSNRNFSLENALFISGVLDECISAVVVVVFFGNHHMVENTNAYIHKQQLEIQLV